MDVKLGQLGSWLAMRDFTPGGILGAIRRGEAGAGPSISSLDGARESSTQESLAAGVDVAWGEHGIAGAAPWPVLPSHSNFSCNISVFQL